MGQDLKWDKTQKKPYLEKVFLEVSLISSIQKIIQIVFFKVLMKLANLMIRLVPIVKRKNFLMASIVLNLKIKCKQQPHHL